MALHVKTNLQTTIVNKTTNPDLFHSADEECGDKAMTLKGMQSLVGGFIQLVNLRKPLVVENMTYTAMIINEEGKLSGLPFNAIATRLAKIDGSIAADDVIVGEAILLQVGEID